MIFVPFLIPLMFVEHLFYAFNQPQEIVQIASTYVKIVAPGIVMYMFGDTYAYFAECQGKPKYVMISTVGASIFHWFIAHYLVKELNMKMTGIAIATSLHFVMRFLIAVLCVRRDRELQKSLIPLNHPDSFKNLGEIAKLGGQSILLYVMGWWAFDVFTQLASQSTETDLAGQTILRNIGLFTYMIPVGLFSAINYLTGMYIGKCRADLAHRIASLCMNVTLIWSIVSTIIILLCKDLILGFYTNNEEVKAVINKAWWVLVIFVFFDCMQGVAAGNI